MSTSTQSWPLLLDLRGIFWCWWRFKEPFDDPYTIFVKVNPVISHLDLSNGPSKTNLGSQRYLSEINEPWPLRPMVELQGRASFLFLRLSEGSIYLSRTLSATFMKVTSARTRVITSFICQGHLKARSEGVTVGCEIKITLSCPLYRGNSL